MSRNFCSSDPGEIAKLKEAHGVRPGSKPRDQRDEALEQLRNELADVRTWAARGWARVKELERRLEAIRESAK